MDRSLRREDSIVVTAALSGHSGASRRTAQILRRLRDL